MRSLGEAYGYGVWARRSNARLATRCTKTKNREKTWCTAEVLCCFELPLSARTYLSTIPFRTKFTIVPDAEKALPFSTQVGPTKRPGLCRWQSLRRPCMVDRM